MANEKITEKMANETKQMDMAVLTEIADKANEQVMAVLEETRAALSKRDLIAYSKSMSILNEKVKVLNQCLTSIEYAKLLAKDNPMIAAVEQFYVEVAKVMESKTPNDNAVAGVNIGKTNKRIDLEKFCKFGGLSTDWAHDSDKLLTLLSLREVNVFELTPSQLAKESYFFIAQARAKKEGETPDSNTQIVKLLQKIVDEAIFVDNGEGKNKYKCNNHDIAFIQSTITKLAVKEKCTIEMCNQRQFKNVMMSVFAHMLGENYAVKTKIKPAAEIIA